MKRAAKHFCERFSDRQFPLDYAYTGRGEFIVELTSGIQHEGWGEKRQQSPPNPYTRAPMVPGGFASTTASGSSDACGVLPRPRAASAHPKSAGARTAGFSHAISRIDGCR